MTEIPPVSTSLVYTCENPSTHEEWVRENYDGLLQMLEASQITRDEYLERLSGIHAYLEKMRTRDALTGLLNGVSFTEALESEQRVMKSSPDYSGHILFIDLDKLKDANEQLGHEGADEILKATSKILEETCAKFLTQLNAGGKRSNVFAGRRSGDEFFVFIGTEQKELVSQFTDSILTQVPDRTRAIFPNWTQTLSAGVRQINANSDPLQAIIEADIAVYAAKSRGRNVAVFYHDLGPSELAQFSRQPKNPTT